MNAVARNRWSRAVAVAAPIFAGTLLLRVVLEPVLGYGFGFMFFFPAVCAAAWIAGKRAGMIVTVLAAFAVWYLWLPPYRSFALRDTTSTLHVIGFLGIASTIVHFISRGRSAMLALNAAREVEAALRANYEVTLRSIGDAVIATDAAGNVTFMNAAAVEMTGWPFETARGASADAIFVIKNEQSGALRSSPVRHVIANRATTALDNHTLLQRRDGTETPIGHRAAPIVGDDGTFRGAVLVFRDIGEQARTRQALSSANATLEQQIADLRQLQEFCATALHADKLETMLEHVLRAALTVNDAEKGFVSLAMPDRDGVTLGASAGFSSDFLDQIKFVPAGMGACGWCYLKRRRVVVEDAATDPLFAPHRQLVEKGRFRAVHSTPLIGRRGKLIGVVSVHFASRHRPSEREMQLMDLYARSAADLIENGQLHAELQRELDARRVTAEELRVMNDRFKLAAHSEMLTLFEQDRDLRYRWLYPAHVEHAPGLGRTDEEMLPAVEGRSLSAIKQTVLSTGTPLHVEVQTTLPDGVHHYDLTVSPKRNRNGEIDGVAGVALDITTRKQAELALTQAKNELARINSELEERVRQRTESLTEILHQMETFSYSVSHDLRAPLRAVATFATILKEDHAAALDAEGLELLHRIIRGTERMTRLVSDLLVYTRVNRHEVTLARVSLARCIAEVIQHAPELQSPRALLQWPASLPAVLGAEPFVVQIFSNLLGNAVKFVRPECTPEVTISAESNGDFVRVWVCDNGVGIKPEHQHRVFGLFERLDAERRYEGSGMGLAIVRCAVQRMGGSVGVESDGRNGCRFWVEFPAVPGSGESDESDLAESTVG